ncbi:hypothetical protein J4221_06370 [Candidatus Pacearchaeota archaeon]|nr:hypothetical protein [Candidatus Pacearchaeota archaeon]
MDFKEVIIWIIVILLLLVAAYFVPVECSQEIIENAGLTETQKVCRTLFDIIFK